LTPAVFRGALENIVCNKDCNICCKTLQQFWRGSLDEGWLCCSRGARRRLEIPRQQQIDFGVAMTGGQRLERGLHVGERLDAIELAGSDERGQGVKGRAFIVDYFNRQIPLRRETGGEDLFSQLCRATWDDGTLLSNADIVNHMAFFMMAAHDTLTSSLTSFVYRLAANLKWQEKVREEHRSLGLAPEGPLPFERLDELVLTEMAFKEAMRLAPPVPSIPRRALRDFEFMAFRIPAGTSVSINPLFTHYMPELWPEPERYDPMRFGPEVSRNRHKFAFVPFGGGAHMCLGLNFAYMQAKCFAWHFLNKFRVSVAPGYRPSWSMWPIPYPRDGLLVTLAAA
jgi:cytochrome P450